MTEEELKAIVKKAEEAFNKLSPEEQREHKRLQRRSYVRGEMLLEHPEMTESYVNSLLDIIGV